MIEDLTKEEKKFLDKILSLSSRDSQLEFAAGHIDDITERVYNNFPSWLKVSISIFSLDHSVVENKEDKIELFKSGSPYQEKESKLKEDLRNEIYFAFKLGKNYSYSEIQEIMEGIYTELELNVVDLKKERLFGLPDYFEIQRMRSGYTFKERKIL